MKIGAIAPWFGSKRTLAPEIVRELGKHQSYWEPFCGSMAVLLGKKPCSLETVNDLHGDLMNLAWVLASPRCTEFYERLSRTLCHEVLVKEAHRRLASGPDLWCSTETGEIHDLQLERAYWFFVASWLGRNGFAGTTHVGTSVAVRWATGGGATPIRFQAAVESIPAWHDRLRNVLILTRDGIDMLERIEDRADAVIYVDPPYIKDSRGSDHTYVHDFDDEDHRRLAELLHRFKRARVVVSYYDSPRLIELYPEIDTGWALRRVTVRKHSANTTGTPKMAPEVLLINGPSCAGDGPDLFDTEGPVE